MRSLVVSHAGKFQAELSHDAIDVALKEPHTILWLDITDPTPEDQVLLREEFGFHPLAIEDAVRSHERPKVDAYGLPMDEDDDGVPDAPDAPVEPPALFPRDGARRSIYIRLWDGRGGRRTGKLVLLPLESLSPAEAEYEAEAGRNGYYFVVFYAAVYDPQEDHIRAHAVSMFIGSNYLVTVHAGPLSHIADTVARWRAPKTP